MADYVKIRAVDPATGGLTSAVYFQRTPDGLVQITDQNLVQRLDGGYLKMDQFTGTDGLTFKDGKPKVVNQQLYVIRPDGTAWQHNDQKYTQILTPEEMEQYNPSSGRIDTTNASTEGEGKVIVGGSGVSGQQGSQGTVTGQPVGSGQQLNEGEQLFKNTEQYQSLSDEEKEIVDLMFGLIRTGGEKEAQLFGDAIQQAIAIADPWAKAQGALLLAEFAIHIDETIFGAKAKMEAVQRARDVLMEDVGNRKEFLTLEQQAEISRQVQSYEQDILSIADAAADKGLTFATGYISRQRAEELRAVEHEDVIQSRKRDFNFRIKELKLRAARGETEAQAELERFQKEEEFSLRKIGQAAETILGSGGVPTETGYTPVGGITGSLEEEKERRIISDVGGIVDLSGSLTEGIK